MDNELLLFDRLEVIKKTIPATSYGLDCSAIYKMLDDWEKENE